MRNVLNVIRRVVAVSAHFVLAGLYVRMGKHTALRRRNGHELDTRASSGCWRHAPQGGNTGALMT